jgi:hypothetical protein
MYPSAPGVQLTRAPGRSAWGVSFFIGVLRTERYPSMAEPSSPIQFEDIPIDEARRMGRGPRMDPQLYQELKTRIPVLSYQEYVRDTCNLSLPGHPLCRMTHTLHTFAADGATHLAIQLLVNLAQTQHFCYEPPISCNQ